MAVQDVAFTQQREAPSRGHLARAWSRLYRKKIAVVCIGLIVVLYGGGIFAEWVAPFGYGYDDQDYSVISDGPSLKHWTGTDRAGRDMFARVLWGIQNTVIITVVSIVTGGLIIGVSLGLISGYLGGKVDTVIMRVGEVFTSFPPIFLMIILAATLKPRLLDWTRWLEDHTFLDGLVRTGVGDYLTISLSLVAFGWIGMARLVRSQVLYLKTTQYVEAARAIGGSTPRIMFSHLLPNAISPIVVVVSMGMGEMIGTEIILSWLGLGIQPPRASLGRMLLESGSLGALRNEPWMLLAPGTAALLMIFAWNLLGDALNDVLNPRTR